MWMQIRTNHGDTHWSGFQRPDQSSFRLNLFLSSPTATSNRRKKYNYRSNYREQVHTLPWASMVAQLTITKFLANIDNTETQQGWVIQVD